MLRRTHAARIGLLGIGIALAAPLHAQSRAPEQPRVTYSLTWQVAPSDLPAAPIWLAEGDDFLRTRLLPESAARLEAALLDDRGREILPAGAELIGLTASQGAIYCSVTQRGGMGGGALGGLLGGVLLGGGGNRNQHCLGDRDKDGRFDYRFTAGGPIIGLQSLNGVAPRRPDPVAGLGYAVVDPASLTAEHFVMLRYVRRASGERYGFAVRFGSGDNYTQLTELNWVEGARRPAAGIVLGSAFILTETDASERIRISVTRTIPPQPFAVVQTITRRY